MKDYEVKAFEIILGLLFRNLPINKYLTTVLIVSLVTYYHTKLFYISLFVGLITWLGYTFYNYSMEEKYTDNRLINTILLLIYLLILVNTVNNMKIFNKTYIQYINFIFIVYILVSYLEYFIHRNIMHCDENNRIFRFTSRLIPRLNLTCKSHKEHHLEVKPNMKIDEVKDEGTLVFSWKLLGILFPVSLLIVLFSNWLSNTQFSFLSILTITFITLFMVFYMWNKIHPKFHDYEVQKLTIKYGPYDNGLFDTSFFQKLLYRNHEAHHIQKGEKKGNYNIILLGADEWMNRNVKTIDNIEYCKTHQEEEICKKINNELY